MPPRIDPTRITNGDVDSVYYVHPSEGPHSVNIAPQLNGSNYISWSQSMERALSAKNKIAFINGSIPIPRDTDLNRLAWERCNCLVHSWIMNSVNPPIAQTIVFLENALDVWNDLKERFSKTDRVRVSNLRTAINNLKQDSKSVLDYFTELRGFWEELNSHRPIPSCTCPQPCRCEAMRSAREFRLEDQIIQFLTGLNDTFYVIKTQVLLMDPLPSINRVYSMVVQEESNNVSLVPKVDYVPVLNEANTLINAYDSKNLLIMVNLHTIIIILLTLEKMVEFAHCHGTGHTIEVCYRKHGFPPNFYKKQTSANASSATTSDNQSLVHIGEEASTPIPGASITKEQYAQLIGLLQQTNLLPSLQTTSSTINHISTHSGPLPNETSGIIFVSTITCVSHAKPDYWILDSGANDHDMRTKKMIGLARQIEGLYRLITEVGCLATSFFSSPITSSSPSLSKSSISMNNCTIIPKQAIWHFRLCHLSHDSLNQSRATQPYELLHFDIWGPVSINSIHNHKYFLTVVDDFGRALLFQSNLPKSFWSYAVNYGAYIINRVNTLLLNNQSPYHMLYHSPPDISQVKVFSSLCYASTLSHHRTKLDTRVIKLVFLGYVVGYKGSILLDLHTHTIFISKNVTHHEHILPYTSPSQSPTQNWQYFRSITNQNNPDSSTFDDPPSIITHNDSPTGSSHSSPIHDQTLSPNTSTVQPNPTPRVSSRARHPPSHLKDYVCATFNDAQTDSSSGTPNSISNFLSYSNISPSHSRFIFSISTNDEPKTYKEACKFDCWNQAMKLELEALENTGTWKIVDLPSNVKPIGCRWCNTASLIWFEKLNSLLIGHGYTQAPSDHSLFVKKTSSSFTILLFYVDDVILAGDYLHEFQLMKNILHQAFKIKDLGVLKYFLGLEVAHSSKGISVCQRKYCLDLLNDSGFLGSKPATTPYDPSIKLCHDNSPPFDDVPS
ncbi:uncharacterized protein LOC131634366 [Vicia villosa]|uniref:uncharacterized protein LOC131634366 n=1 Tax=Vicia villosa TaxID=3911 RepID=UPI00273B3F9D|nr:uncharacterized protein LOC131634366 [Vicia villosa]